MQNGKGDVRFLPAVLGITGGIVLLVGIAVLGWILYSKLKRDNLLKNGECVQAYITGFPIDERVRMNGRPSFCIECNYMDPQSGVLHIFRSTKMFVNPATCVDSETVRVYVDKKSDFKNYYVDVDSILPTIKRH